MTVQFYLMQDYLPKALSVPRLCVYASLEGLDFFPDLIAQAFMRLVDLPNIFFFSLDTLISAAKLYFLNLKTQI